MRAFALNAEQAIIFFELCKELKADTEEQRVAILDALADMGQVHSITQTPMTKEEYKQHLAKHFTVGEVQSNGSIRHIPSPNDQPKGTQNG